MEWPPPATSRKNKKGNWGKKVESPSLYKKAKALGLKRGGDKDPSTSGGEG
ncbi:hypothetical protein D187_008754 [Cystobacter fuscus DSM 2262]|uniref:Uncharacterized protein n=1 Tax=Cystobacter fuscus (strain ATCC 25194 / DSM 2262 / NBRC 100088 / M29) TaxID=1242864 RepID=S9PHP0_CYSF2|nr:hypothetical protein D187_008754 [Cystobacter fuscus DSM 2262]